MKLIFSFFLLISICALAKGRRFHLFRSSRAAAEDDESPSSQVFGLFSSLADDLGFKSIFRDAQIRVLGATESLLDQSSDIYDSFQEVADKIHKDRDQRSSELKKAIRYLKTEARRLREDLEDEIEIEKEKAQELEATEKKESDKKIKKLNAAIKKLGEVTSKRIHSIRSNEEKKIKKTRRKVDRLRKRIDSKTDTESDKKGQFADGQGIDELTTKIPIAGGLGDGFGNHG